MMLEVDNVEPVLVENRRQLETALNKLHPEPLVVCVSRAR